MGNLKREISATFFKRAIDRVLKQIKHSKLIKVNASIQDVSFIIKIKINRLQHKIRGLPIKFIKNHKLIMLRY